MPLESKADYYNTQITTIKTDFFSILGGYKEKYIDHFTNPSDDGAAESYDDCIFQLQTKNQDLYNVANNIQNDIDALNNKMKMMTAKLNSEKTLNDDNSNLFEDIQTTNSGSKIMINDYKTAYNKQTQQVRQLKKELNFLLGKYELLLEEYKQQNKNIKKINKSSKKKLKSLWSV